MQSPLLTAVLEHYPLHLSLLAAAGIAVVTMLGKRLFLLVPAFREAGELNRSDFQRKMQKPAYAANHMWNRKWGLIDMVVIFGLILPFCVTLDLKPWWAMLLDVVVILLVYDLVYYVVHRFLFHGRGPLLWMHAVHHQQHNPCRMDSSYIHPLEVAIGLGLYAGTIFVLSRLMGEFHVVTIVITWVAFSQLNLHNHDLWKADRFPFRYLSYLSKMHHNHHAKFTGGNFATISLMYDWMFGTLDNGDARKASPRPQA